MSRRKPGTDPAADDRLRDAYNAGFQAGTQAGWEHRQNQGIGVVQSLGLALQLHQAGIIVSDNLDDLIGVAERVARIIFPDPEGGEKK